MHFTVLKYSATFTYKWNSLIYIQHIVCIRRTALYRQCGYMRWQYIILAKLVEYDSTGNVNITWFPRFTNCENANLTKGFVLLSNFVFMRQAISDFCCRVFISYFNEIMIPCYKKSHQWDYYVDGAVCAKVIAKSIELHKH